MTTYLFASTAAVLLTAASVNTPLSKAEATIDLATVEGTTLVQGQWRYHDTKIIEVDFRSPGEDGQPGKIPNKT